MTWYILSAAAIIALLLLAYFALWALCLSASIADDANENEMLRKVAEDEIDAKIGRAVRGETKWRRRMNGGKR